MVLVGAVVVIGLSGVASAADASVLADGHSVVLSSPSGSLTQPSDGRLIGPRTSSEVLGVAWPASAAGYVADSGHRLVELSVQVSQRTGSSQLPTPSTYSLAVVAPGQRTSLDASSLITDLSQSNGSPSTATATYLASVPNDTHQVYLTQDDSGFTQSFSLWSLTRPGASNPLLYASSSGSVVDPVAKTLSVPIANPADSVTLNSNLVITQASLSNFAPGGSTAIAPKGSAYLSLSMNAGPPNLSYGEPNWGHFFSGLGPYPGSAVTFTPSGGAPIAAVMSNPVDQTNNPNSSSDNGTVDATYTFQVPETTKTGTLSFAPYSTTGVEYTGFTGGDPVPLNVGGPVSTPLSFTTTAATAHQPTPPWVGQPVPATGRAAAGSSTTAASSSGGSGITVPLAIAFLIVVGGGLVLWRRRRGDRADAADSAAEEASPEPAGTEGTVTDSDVTENAVSASSSSPAVVNVPFVVAGTASSPVAGDADAVRIEFLGPVRILGHQGSVTDIIRALLCFLAAHPDRPMSGEEIQTALWPMESTVHDISKKAFLNNVSSARKLIGSEHLPDAQLAGGYGLVDVSCDWTELQRLAEEAAHADGDVAAELRRHALGLVRGRPFEAETKASFRWVTETGLEARIVNLVIELARTQAEFFFDAGDLVEAEWAARQGLLAAREELVLWEILTDVLEARGDAGVLSRHLAEATSVLGTDEGERLRQRAHLSGDHEPTS